MSLKILVHCSGQWWWGCWSGRKLGVQDTTIRALLLLSLTCFCQRLFGRSRLPTSPPAVLAILALAALPRSLHWNWLKLPLAASPRRRRPSRSQQRLQQPTFCAAQAHSTSPHPIYLLRSSFPLHHFLLLRQLFLLLKDSLSLVSVNTSELQSGSIFLLLLPLMLC